MSPFKFPKIIVLGYLQQPVGANLVFAQGEPEVRPYK